MKRRDRLGQATVEFAVVFLLLSTVLFGAIEVARAVFEKHSLARAAEVVTQELAQTDPSNSDSSWTLTAPMVSAAISNSNHQANLGLSTIWPQTTGITTTALMTGTYNSGSNECDATGTGSSCVSAPNQDSSVMVIGYPDLTTPITVSVTVSQPYKSFIQFPLQFLNGRASETVAATTLSAQQSSQQ
jgi:Flp pilus assembly protein TadG